MKEILKSWKSTVVGLAMVVIAIHKYIETGEIDYAELVIGLAGVGFILTKDANKSHTQD